MWDDPRMCTYCGYHEMGRKIHKAVAAFRRDLGLDMEDKMTLACTGWQANRSLESGSM